VRIACWNIQQGGGDRIEGIATALADIGTDVCVLSEYTVTSSGRVIDALGRQGFDHIVHTVPEPGWGGVLIASTLPLRAGQVDSCPSPDRWLHLLVDGHAVEIGAAYIPNAERSSTEKRTYWEWLLGIGSDLVSHPVIICGDLNTGLPYVDETAKTLKCADLMQRMLDAGWTDLWREANPDGRESSWWSNVGNGFRLDHALASPTAAQTCRDVAYVTEIGGRCLVHPGRRHEGCDQRPLSDHAMLLIDLD
jgi:exodeoxyribonuclease III